MNFTVNNRKEEVFEGLMKTYRSSTKEDIEYCLAKGMVADYDEKERRWYFKIRLNEQIYIFRKIDDHDKRINTLEKLVKKKK